VLLLACANVANLLLIRSSVRSPELAVRSALGASRWRLARQPLVEAIVIAAFGGVLGMGLAWLLVRFARPFAAQRLPFSEHIALDGTALWFALGVTVSSTLLVGALPALQASRANLVDRLRGGAASRGGLAEMRLRAALVSLQFALAITLLIGAGLLVQSVRRLSAVPLGYDPTGMLNFGISPPKGRYDAPAAAAALYQRILQAVRQVPTVQSVDAGGGALLETKVEVEGRPTSGPPPTALYHPISTEYFALRHVPIKQGRGFTDDDMKSPSGLLVSDTLARQLWPGGNAVGQRITIYRQSQARPDIGQPITLPVVGVAADYHQFGPENPAFPQVYLPYTLEVWPWMSFDARAGQSPRVLADVERAVHAVDPAITFLWKPTFDRTGRTPAFSDPRMFVTSLLTGFALSALLLAAIGLYGVVAYAVTQRTREIGIRLAIGATPANITRLLVRDASAFVVVGMIGGVLAALAVTRVLTALLFQTAPTDVGTFIVVPLVLAVVALAASAVPALRASRTDPSIVIRAE
jgi:predicted permease